MVNDFAIKSRQRYINMMGSNTIIADSMRRLDYKPELRSRFSTGDDCLDYEKISKIPKFNVYTTFVTLAIELDLNEEDMHRIIKARQKNISEIMPSEVAIAGYEEYCKFFDINPDNEFIAALKGKDTEKHL